MALEFHLSFQKLREDLSPLLKSVFLCSSCYSKTKNQTFQMPIECTSTSHFSKDARKFQYIQQPIRDKAWKIRQGIQPIEIS